ncbi:MAG: hypothetical protein M0Z33_12040 [Actinomycetota bacterium]|nr:hypothetical protein [Actinomycetota bacterium]
MNVRYHLGRRLAALAVTGGAATALFGGSPVHTQFSASQSHTATIIGGTVNESVTNGDFTCSGLVPPNNGPENGSNPPVTYPGQTCNETVTFANTGSVPESFDITLGTINGTAGALANLDQLVFTVGGTNYTYAQITGAPGPIHVATIAPGANLASTITIGLAANNSDSAQNAWNGGYVHIPYTVTATPSAS